METHLRAHFCRLRCPNLEPHRRTKAVDGHVSIDNPGLMQNFGARNFGTYIS